MRIIGGLCAVVLVASLAAGCKSANEPSSSAGKIIKCKAVIDSINTAENFITMKIEKIEQGEAAPAVVRCHIGPDTVITIDGACECFLSGNEAVAYTISVRTVAAKGAGK